MPNIRWLFLEITVGVLSKFNLGTSAYNKLVSFMNGKFHGEVF